MERLADFLRASRLWSQSKTGLDLFHEVSDVLRNNMSIDMGMMIYARRFIHDELGQLDSRPKAYITWGISKTIDELNLQLSDSPWYSSHAFMSANQWSRVEKLPEPWRSDFQRDDIQYIGAWGVIDNGKVVGMMVLGRRAENHQDDEATLDLCAAHASLIMELLVARRRVEEVARRDPLTNALNRRGFMDALPAIQDKALASGEQFFLGIIDVNKFKQINDEHGHASGDLVLVDIVRTLMDALKGRGAVSRFGGDEFVFAFLADDMDEQSVETQLRACFEDKSYTVCIGTAEVKSGQWEDGLKFADEVLYRHKVLL